LIVAAIPLSLATNENEPKDSPWTMSGFNFDSSLNESIEFGSFSKPFLSPFYADFISEKNA
jgi:hypothetical protein